MAYLTGLSALGVDQAVFTGMDGLVIEALGQGEAEDRKVLAVRVGEFLLGAVVHRGLSRKAVGQELSRIALRLEEAWREG